MKKRLNLNLCVGSSCFAQCLGCYNFFGKNKTPVSNKTILSFLDYAKKMGISKVTLSGGDPLSRPDIVPLLQEIKKRGFCINLDTLGTPLLSPARSLFFDRKWVSAVDPEKLSRLVDLIGIPLDGATNRVISTFRTKRENILNEQIEILALLHSFGAKICINTVVHKKNIAHLEETLKIIPCLSALVKWQFFQFMPIGPLGYKNREKYVIDKDAFSSFKEKMTHALKKSAFKGSAEFKGCSDRKGRYLLVDSDGFAWIPKSSFTSSWDENQDCNNQRVILGNIKEKANYSHIFNAILFPVQIIENH